MSSLLYEFQLQPLLKRIVTLDTSYLKVEFSVYRPEIAALRLCIEPLMHLRILFLLDILCYLIQLSLYLFLFMINLNVSDQYLLLSDCTLSCFSFPKSC